MSIDNLSYLPWNKGKLVGQKLPLKLRENCLLRVRLQLSKNLRELALVDLVIDSKLRGSDLVKIRVSDISKFGVFACRAMVRQQKTGRPVQFEIAEQSRDAIRDWIDKSRLTGSDSYFPVE